MSWVDRDTSQHAGEPMYLLEVTRPEATFRWTNGDEDYIHAGNVYAKTPFTIDDLEQGAEPDATTLTLRFPVQNDLVQALMTVGDVFLGETAVKLITVHRDEPEGAIGFMGIVVKTRIEDRSTAVIEVETFDGLIQQQIPRIAIAMKCQNMLGDDLCKLNLEDFKFESTITAIDLQDGRVLTIAGLMAEEGDDGNRFLGGTIFRELTPGVWKVAGFIMYRYDGDRIVMMDPNPALTVGMAVKLYPGDDRHITTCRARFNNVPNFTGTMPMGNPDRSIMEGTGFLGYALEEDATDQGTTTDPPPRPV